MSLSVQSSTASQIALDSLANRPETTASAASAPRKVADPGRPSSILALSDGLASALPDESASSLTGAATLADSAVSTGNVIVDLLGRMRQAAANASDPSVAPDARKVLDASFQANLAKIGQVLAHASVDGVNLIDGSQSGDLQVGGNSGLTATLSATDLSATGSLIGLSANAGLTDAGSAKDLAGQLDQAISTASAAVARISTQAQSIQGHLDLASQATWLSVSNSSGGLNSSMDQDGARLQALLVQQQLSADGAAVANQSPQSILALFR